MPVTLIDRGDIFKSTMQALVCPTNRDGVMGAGLAYAFKVRYPGLEDYHKRHCKRNRHFGLNDLLVWGVRAKAKHLIVCVPTKFSWKDPASDIELIKAQLANVRLAVEAVPLTGLAVPALGCGLGRLPWATVRPVLEEHFEDYPIPVELYPPH